MSNPQPVERLIERLTTLPGIGRRSAERMAFAILKMPREEAAALAQAIMDLKDRVRHCRICFNLTDVDPCAICTAPGRDRTQVLVVEAPRDLVSFESTGLFRGVYHVLAGQIDPLAGIGPGDLTAGALLDRVDHPDHHCGGERIQEVILGLNPTLEGDSTALYLAEELARRGVRVSRLARGIPSGSQLEYASAAVLADALAMRRDVAR